jgi:antirestriction protein ArdC
MNRKDITNEIVKAMEKGVCPWRKTWSNFTHKNLFSGKFYQGINQLLLSLSETAFPFWGSFMQWKGAGCWVRKGEKASHIVFFTVVQKTEEEDGETRIVDRFPVLRYYNIFHVGQVEDPKNKFKHLTETKTKSDYDTANKIIELSGVRIEIGGDRAYYHWGEDYIRTPTINQFESEETYLAAMFHELAHWADYNIIGTKFTTSKNSVENAYCELVAELAACFLCRACNIPNDLENHESYIASWIKCMKNDVGYIWRASRDASKITDYFLKLAGIVYEEENETDEVAE